MLIEEQSTRFLNGWLWGCILCALGVAVFNAAIDPYLLFNTPRIPGVNGRKPAVDTQERLMKAYEVLQVAPRSVVLGSSRPDFGIDAQSPLWPAGARPVYNLSLGGGGPYRAYRYLQHVMAGRHLTLVTVGLDFEYFQTGADDARPMESELESRLTVTPAGEINLGRRSQHFRDVLQALLSLDALEDSVGTLAAGGDSSDLVTGNRDSVYFHLFGSYPIFAAADLFWIHLYQRDTHKKRVAMNDLRAIIALCKAQDTQVVLFINPVHADLLEILDLSGRWTDLETWKRELVTLTAELVGGGSDSSRIQLWDFMGYDSYSTESFSTGHPVLRWFWDPAHYTRALGDLMLGRIFNVRQEPFGVFLTSETLEMRFAAIREERRVYRERHRTDAQRIRDLYDAVGSARQGGLCLPGRTSCRVGH